MDVVKATARFEHWFSSQATVAGYKAVLIAADRVQKMFPLLTLRCATRFPPKKATPS